MEKYCPTCETLRDIGEFDKDRSRGDGWRWQCRSCQKQHSQDHKAEITARKKQYYQDNKAEIAARGKRYRKDNKQKISDRQKRYSQTEAGKATSRKAWQKRRALKRGATVKNFNPIKVLERDRYVCQNCGRKTRPDFNQWHPLYPNLDHIVPLSLGGDHSKANTQCLCRECNMTKHNTGKGDQLRLF